MNTDFCIVMTDGQAASSQHAHIQEFVYYPNRWILVAMKDLYWLGTSLDDLKGFPVDIRREAGTDLRLVQQGRPA